MASQNIAFHRAGNEATDQICYEVPYRIYDALAYPVKSPNRSTIIIHGHQHGLRLLWYGGRPFKSDVTASNSPDQTRHTKTNGTSHNAAVVISLDDSDEDGDDATKVEGIDDLKFDKEEVSFQDTPGMVVQDLDLDFGTAVLKIATPAVPQDAASSLAPHERKLLAERIVLALCCEDGAVRVLTVPLVPPSAEMKKTFQATANLRESSQGRGPWNETLLILPFIGGPLHKHTNVAICFSPPVELESVDDDIMQEGESTDKPQIVPKPRPGEVMPDYDLLVASSSKQYSGVLFVYRIPIVKSNVSPREVMDLSGPPEGVWQMHHLPFPPKSLAFNSSLVSENRPTQILASDSTGCIRILELDQNSTERSALLISLFSPFSSNTALSSTPHRKQILSAQWVLSGRGILALLQDGTWGIWNLGSDLFSKDTSKPTSASSGGAVLPFSVSGNLRTVTSSAQSANGRSPSSVDRTPGFAPLTPATRKNEKSSLFTSHQNGPTSPKLSFHGGIVVSSFYEKSAGESVESVTLHYAGTLFTIRNLRQYLTTRIKTTQIAPLASKSGPLFGLTPSHSDALYREDGLNLHGESLVNASFMPPSSSKSGEAISCSQGVIIAGERQICVLLARATTGRREIALKSLVAQNIDRSDNEIIHSDQDMIVDNDDSDVAGINRVLSSLEDPTISGSPSTHARRRVEFR